MGRADLAFDVIVEDMVRSFSAGRSAARARGERARIAGAPTFDPMVIGEDLYEGTAYAMNRASDGLETSRFAALDRGLPADNRAATVAVRSPRSEMHSPTREESGPNRRLAGIGIGESRAAFDPIVVGDDLYEGVAYSLNRASEGLAMASHGSASRATVERGLEPAVASRVSQLSVALRLTREAVYAWSNLLHGPAVVAISR